MQNELGFEQKKTAVDSTKLQDGLFLLEADGYFKDVNTTCAEMLNYTKNEFIKYNFFIDTFKDSRQRNELISRINHFGYVKNFETELFTKNGSAITVPLTLFARKDQNGTLVGYDGIIHASASDQEQELNEETSSERTEILNTMVGKYNHEMKQPLTLIYNYARILEEKSADHDPDKRMYQVLLKESKRLADFVKNGLDLFSKDESS